jgi:pimeloyl-ACP methyl ester carboxylesterase
VISFDIAGFGRTPPLPYGTPPTVGNLVDALADSLSALGLSCPIDFAGNSLGGIMALEAARRGMARSAVAISPAGLWESRPPARVNCVFSAMRAMSTRVPGALKAALRVPWFREIALALPLSAGSRRMSATDACLALDDLRQSTAFDATFESTRPAFCGQGITAPTTIVFGQKDWMLPAWSRRRHAVPAHVRWLTKPDWGHVPLWVDPAGVAELILDATR